MHMVDAARISSVCIYPKSALCKNLFSSGRTVDEKGLRLRVFKAGVDPAIRKEVWQYLLGLHPSGTTAAQRSSSMLHLRNEYQQIKAQWTTIADKQAARQATHVSALGAVPELGS